MLTQHLVFYSFNQFSTIFASDDGRVLKVVLVKDSHGKVQSNLLEEIFVTPRDNPEAILNVEVITNNEGEEVLLVNTNSTVAQIPLERCSNLSSW